MTTTRSTVRIFISSPGDVNDERDKARRVIDDLQRHHAGATLEPVLWEDLALPATASFQETIDFILRTKPIDIAVFILWSRLGSPVGPPISRPDGSPYRSGTEREFDLMLAAFAESGRQRPVILAYARDDDGGFRQTLTTCEKERLEEIVAQRGLAESFICEQFKDAQGRNLRAYHSYREPLSFAERLHTHLRQVLDELLGGEFAPRWTDEPYRGLAFFDVSHADIFHGREGETCDLLQRLRDQEQAGCAFAVVVGASGSGKSSLARAGVADFLTRHSFDDGVQEWRAVAFVPGLCGNDLVTGLVRALAERLPELRSSATALDDLADGLVKDPALTVKLSVAPAFARAAEHASGAVRVLLVLDQMEELWTDRRITAENRERFLSAIETLARSGHVSVLATLRSDFYPHAQRGATFLRLKGERGHYDLSPPGTAALQRLITEPARLAGLRFERDERTEKTLDEVILEDASRDPAALPLLQYALCELYRRRDETARTLTFAAYENLGGVEGALGRRAADTFDGLPPEARAALPEILPLLVTVDVAGEQAAVRRRAPLAELKGTPARRMLTESLIAARFLTTDREDDIAVAGLAHEALLRRWDPLADWVTANREHLRLRARVEQSRQRWEQQRGDPSLLLPPGLPLEEGRQLLTFAPALLSTETAQYIRASITEHDLELTRRRRRRRASMAAMSGLTVLALAGATLAWINQREAELRGNENAQLAERADDKTKEARRHLYTTQMNLAPVAWEKAQIGRVRQLLGDHSPKPGLEDLRGFEWYYWNRLCDSYQFELAGHDGTVNYVAISADGKLLASASSDKSVRIWDAVTRKSIHKLTGHGNDVTCVAFSPDGTRVASCGNDGTVIVWDCVSGGKVFATKAETEKLERDAFIGFPVLELTVAVTSVAFSPDGTRMASSTMGSGLLKPGKVKVWDTTNGAELWSKEAHTYRATSVAFSPDGQLLASGGGDKQVKLWQAATGELTRTFKEHDGDVTSVAFSAEGKRLASAGDDGTIIVLDVVGDQGPLTFKGHTGTVKCVVFNNDGSRLASAGGDRTIKIWDAKTGRDTHTIRGHDGAVESVTFSPDGRRLASAGSDRTVKVWDTTIVPATFTWSAELTSFTLFAKANLSLSADGKRVATAGQGKVRIWDAISGRETPEVKTPYGGETSSVVVLSPDGKQLAAGINSIGIRLGFLNDFGPLSTARDDFSVRLIDAISGRTIHTLNGHQSRIAQVAFSPDGKRPASASWDKTVKLWDAASGIELRTLTGHTGLVYCVAFSPDGKRLASGGDDRTLRVWDAASGGELLKLEDHEASVTSLAFSQDGRWLAGCEDRIVKLRDAATGRVIHTLTGHTDQVNAVAFTPDGSRLASAGSDQTIKLWDTVTGQETLTLQADSRAVTSVAFSADGKQLASIGNDEMVMIWDARPWTQELRDEREAVSLIQFLRNQGKAMGEWPEAITTNQTISESVRERALQFAREWKSSEP